MRDIPFGRPIIGEEEKRAVCEVLNGPILVHGPKSTEFEKSFGDFCGISAEKCVSVSSCTAALHLSYFSLGIGVGDEVIVPAETHTATAHAVEFCGAKPIFVDAELSTGNIDIDSIEKAVTDKTRAISVVHFLGMPVDMDSVNNIAKKYDLYVIEDCALAIGSYYKNVHAGMLGDAGCFSFYPVKHMTTAEGGMFVSKDLEFASKINRRKAFGVDKHVGQRKLPGQYDVDVLGYNYRMNEIQAAIGIEQVKKLSGFLAKRKDNYNCLVSGLKEIEELSLLTSTHGDFVSSHYCLCVLLNDKLTEKRVDLILKLKEKGIGTSIYYPRPVPHLRYYKEKYGYSEDSFPNASRISYGSIALSVGPHLEEADMVFTAEMLKEAISEL